MVPCAIAAPDRPHAAPCDHVALQVAPATRKGRRRSPKRSRSGPQEDALNPDLQDVRAEVRELVRSKGLRATSPRIEVLVVLHEAAAPLTHEQVMDALTEGVYDRASVWRILADLADAHILRRMDLGDRVWRYELHDDCRSVRDDHPHFLCESCGDVRCLPSVHLRTEDGTLPTALQGAEFRVRVSGRCATCATT